MISEEAKKGEWMYFYCIRRVCSVEAGTFYTDGAFESLVSACLRRGFHRGFLFRLGNGRKNGRRNGRRNAANGLFGLKWIV